jgi:LSD1 subclass zinc finger protein
MSDALWQRWEGFLAKIVERQNEIFAEADEGVREIINSFPEDAMPLGNALQGLRFRIEELKQKVNDTWEQQVSPKFDEVGAAFAEKGRDRKDDFVRELAAKWDLFGAQLEALFYENLKPRAEAGEKKVVNCGGCGAPLKLPTRKDAVSHKCPACGAVNQVLAETAVAIYQGAGHALATLEALPLRHQIERFRVDVDRQRRANSWAPEPVESLDRWLAMEQAYWDKYAQVKAATLGTPVDHELVKSRVDAFMEYTLKRDQRWRKAKGL